MSRSGSARAARGPFIRRRHAQHAPITPFATISAKGIADYSASSTTVPFTSIVVAAINTLESKGASASMYVTMWMPPVDGDASTADAEVQF